MEFHQLRYFEAAARLGSMMAAAAECHVSQPALSVQIRKLEEEAGERLMERRPRGIFLTPAGDRTLRTARIMLAEQARWKKDMERHQFEEARTLRIAAQYFISSEVLPPAIADTLSHKPGRWSLSLHERPAARMEEAIRSGAADIALYDRHAANPKGFECETLLRMPYRLFFHETHPFATVTVPLTLSHMPGSRFLLFSQAPDLKERLNRATRHLSPPFEPAFSSEHASVVFELVASGHGVAVLPADFEKRAKRRKVLSRPLADYEEEILVTAARMPGTPLPESARRLFESIRRHHRPWAVENTEE